LIVVSETTHQNTEDRAAPAITQEYLLNALVIGRDCDPRRFESGFQDQTLSYGKNIPALFDPDLESVCEVTDSSARMLR
jgi:hypothetical protein